MFCSGDDDSRFNDYFNDDEKKGQSFYLNLRPGNHESERRPGNSNNDDYWNKRPGYGNRDEDRNTRPDFDRRRPDYGDRDEDRNTRPDYDRRRPGHGDRDRRPGYDLRDRDQPQDRDRWASTDRRRDPDGYYTDTSPVTSSIRDRYGSQESSHSRDKYYNSQDFFQKRQSLESRESHLSYGK